MEVGNLLLRLGKRPETLAEMTSAFETQDPDRFGRVVSDALGLPPKPTFSNGGDLRGANNC